MELYLCIYFVLKSLNIVYPIKPIDIQESKNEFITFINHKVKSQEDKLIDKVLDSIAIRESRGNYKAVSPTADYGRYQLNQIHFYSGICKGITFQQFLNNPVLQEQKARELMKLHILLIKQKGLLITETRLHKSWFGIAYALY